MDKEKEIIQLKKSFIVETLRYENIILTMIVGIFIGFFSKGLIDKTFIEESSYLILLIIFAIILILGELAIESWRIKKYNELKREIEENKLHEKIKLRPIKC